MTTLIKKLGTMDEPLRDLVDQINRALLERDKIVAPLLAMLAIGRVICAGRCGTTTTASIAFSEVVGATPSIAGTDLRLTFDEPRPVGPNGPTYMPFAVAFTAASARFYHDSSVSSASFCEIRLRDGGGGLVNQATTAVNLAVFVLDRD